MEDVFGLATAVRFDLRRLQPFAHLLTRSLARVERRGGAFEELVDDVSVVAPEGLSDLDVSELSRSDFHAANLILGSGSSGYARALVDAVLA